MTDDKQDTIKSSSAELNEEELGQVQAGAATARRGTSSSQARPTTRRDSSRVRFDIGLSVP